MVGTKSLKLKEYRELIETISKTVQTVIEIFIQIMNLIFRIELKELVSSLLNYLMKECQKDSFFIHFGLRVAIAMFSTLNESQTFIKEEKLEIMVIVKVYYQRPVNK